MCALLDAEPIPVALAIKEEEGGEEEETIPVDATPARQVFEGGQYKGLKAKSLKAEVTNIMPSQNTLFIHFILACCIAPAVDILRGEQRYRRRYNQGLGHDACHEQQAPYSFGSPIQRLSPITRANLMSPQLLTRSRRSARASLSFLLHTALSLATLMNGAIPSSLCACSADSPASPLLQANDIYFNPALLTHRYRTFTNRPETTQLLYF